MPDVAHRAGRAGFTAAQIVDHETRGRVFCARCRGFHPAEAFGVDTRRADGLAASCKASLATAKRQNRQWGQFGREFGVQIHPWRDHPGWGIVLGEDCAVGAVGPANGSGRRWEAVEFHAV